MLFKQSLLPKLVPARTPNPSLRSARRLSLAGCLPQLLPLLLVLSACAEGTEPRTSPDGKDPDAESSPSMVGVPDLEEEEPTELEGQAMAGDLVVNVGELSPGDYKVSIVSVDGSNEQSTRELSVTKKPQSDSEILARLTLPEGLESQADLVKWNVKIERQGDTNEVLLLKSLLYFVTPYEVQLEGPSQVTTGKEVAYRVTARDPVTLVGLPDREVAITLVQEGQEPRTLNAVTDELGSAVLNVALEEPGSYAVEASAEGASVAAKISQTVQSQNVASKLLLTTDKPLYKPGQTIQLRALALERAGNVPVANTDAVLEVEDGKGNKVFKKSLRTDAYGIVSAPFKIGSVVNEGTYKLRAIVGDSSSEKTVEVSQYALPKFRLQTQTDKPWYLAGETISGVIDAHYFFGKAVQGGTITLEAATIDVGRNVYQQVMGQTNAEGTFEFSVSTPGTLVGLPLEQGLALINLTVSATDMAGQQVTADTVVRIAQSPLVVSVVPEATTLVSGIPNRLNVFVTDPLGAPINGANVVLTPAQGEALDATSDAYGHAEVEWTPTSDAGSISVDVTHGDLTVNDVSFSFSSQGGAEHVLLRTDKSVYDVGETVNVEVLTSDDEGSIFVDWLNDGQAVDLRTLEPEDGSASFSVTLDETMLGDNRIEAYVVQADGNLVRAGRTIFARNASNLNVAISTDQEQYEPGAPARISFSVTDESGAPVAAALGVQIVDEAVFSLIDARPGLLNTYFELEDQFATPSYQLAPPPGSLAGLIFDRPEGAAAQAAAQSKAQATFAALGNQALMGLRANSWPGVVSSASSLLQPFYTAEKSALLKSANAHVDAAVNAVIAAGCSLAEYYCTAQNQSFSAVLAKELQERVEAFDFWGNAYTVAGDEYTPLYFTTRGPDEKNGNSDDYTLQIAMSELDFSQSAQIVNYMSGVPGATPTAQAGVPVNPAPGPLAPPPALAPPEAFEDDGVDFAEAEPEGAGGNSGPGADPSDNSGSAPRVRNNFPETLYFNPAVITDGSGEASINLDLADSITEWRISSMANSQSGKLGSATGSMTVFQDFFVDVDFPATLTRGDEVTFPIAVYNYLAEPQTVTLELQAESWYAPLGETTLSVELEPGEVQGVSFPVQVLEVGLKTLTVQGLGSAKSDAVARSVRVIPDGKAISRADSGSVGTTVSHTVNFVEGAVVGSQQLYLNIFPTFLSQAVQGLDSMLQVPSGCFEQTTANAWPNVLVTRYMQETGQITPDVLLKAESLMSAGYQRLLTFEHPGGGFSWFGTEDPAPFLSVTAFGLMEFHDMAKVHEVDEAMLQRTLSYLLSQQQADGSWTGDMSEFFSFHTSSLRNTAFTLMAVGSAEYSGPETQRAIDFIKAQLTMETVDGYTLALIANALAATAPGDALLGDLLTQLAAMGSENPEDDTQMSWDSGDTQTNFYGYGADAAVTTTAMVTHAMLLAGGYSDLVNKGLNFVTANKDSLGNFGSTQATVWALKTLLLAATKGTEAAVGDLVVEVDGQVAQSVELTEAQSDVMTTVDLASFATPGDHIVTLTFSGEGKASYNLVSNYNIPWVDAPADGEGPLSVAISYDRTLLQVDETVTASVVVNNNTASTQNMALVTVGLPPGFEVERDDFAQYLSAGTLSRFEITGKQLILYVSELGPNATLQFDYRLKATLPVKASDGGSSVYPYYQPDQKRTAPEQTLEVTQLL